jgi:TonB family protein
MTADRNRVQSSVFLSLAFHGLIFGLYLFLKMSQRKNELILTQVEFIELRPETVVQTLPQMQAPRGVMDFIKMALPQLRQPEPQEAKPQEMPLERTERFKEVPLDKQLVDKGKPIARSSAIQLKNSELPRARQANLAEVSARPQVSASLADMADTGPAIDLEAVGRTAVRASGLAIRIDDGRRNSGSAGFRELTAPTARAPVSSGQTSSGASYALKEAAPAARRTALPSASPAIGYGKGGGISLKEGVMARPAAASLPTAQASASSGVDEALRSAGASKKAVDLSGPLAQRKILSAIMPRYPEWARARGIQAETVIRFFVSADGEVRERMYIERTSGHKELDDLCIEALKKWKFAPLTAEEADQWGIVTFRFRLK